MSDTAAPIELAPKQWSRASRALQGARVGGRWVHLALALAVVGGVFVQVYLIGAYIFGAGQGALDAHKTAGWTVHGFELLIFVAALVAWLPWVDLVLSFVLALIGTVQVSLASEHRWVGGLHPVLALVVVGLAAMLVLRALRRGRNAAEPAARPRGQQSGSERRDAEC
jgi:hypothetical protein